MEPNNGDPQSDPYVASLANADSQSVKSMADSLYHEAPGAALVTRTPADRKNQSAVRSMYDFANKHFGGYLDPVVRGAVKGYNEMGRATAGAMAFVSGKLGMDDTAPFMQDLRRIQRDGMVTAKIADSALGPDQNTGLHAFVRDAAQFATVNELTGGRALAGEATGFTKAAIHAVHGAFDSAVGFDPRQERVANLLSSAPYGIGAVASAVAANPNDSEAKARFKAGLEGLALGSTIDAAMAGLSRFAGKGMAALRTYAGTGAKAADAVPQLSSFAPAEPAAEVAEPFTVEPTPLGQHQVVPKDAAVAAEAAKVQPHPTFDTPEQAESVASSLNLAARNAAKPKLDVTPEQADYLRTLARWIHDTGKYDEFQTGTLDPATGLTSGGVHDVNFSYDLEPEQVGHLISSMSAVFRKEIDAARVPQSLMRDAGEGSSITHAETVAKAVEDHGGTTPDAARSRFNQVADAVDEAPSTLVAAKVLRQNLGQSAAQWARVMDADPTNTVAHSEFVKSANSLLQTFVAESRLRSGGGRLLEANKIRVGANGAAVSAEDLGNALRRRAVDPLDVLHFELVDEPTSEGAVKQLDDVHPSADTETGGEEASPAGEATPADNGAEPKPSKAGKGSKIKKPAKDAPNPGPNTYTVADEALSKIDNAMKAIDDAELERKRQDVPTAAQAESRGQASDKQVLKAVRKDETLTNNAKSQLGITEEDAKLAKERLRAANNIVAEARDKANAGKPNPLEGLSHDELNDVASIDAERIKRLADAQRSEPLVDPRPAQPEGDAATPKDAANVGTNTYTLIDEADHRISEAEKKIDEELKKQSKMTPEETAARQDKLAARQLPKNDPQRVTAAVDWLGGTDEDVKLAKDRLTAIRQTIAEKRAQAGINTVDWSRYSDVELDDLAMMHGERIMQLADEQRKNPMVPRRERTVYLTTRQARALARQMTYVPRDSKEQEQVLRAVLGMGRKATADAADAAPSTWDKITAYRRWSLLSAPTTPEVNFFSALSTALYRPVEGILGGAAQLDAEATRRNGDLMVGTLKSFHDAWNMAKLSWESGNSILTSRPDTSLPAMTDATTGPLKKVLGWLGVNERLMTAGDEFAQQIAYRGHVYAQSLSNARSAGITDSGEIARRLGEDISSAFDSAGRGQNPSAVAYAQDVTLRRQLEHGVGQWIEDGARKVPAIRVLFPFTRIPANLVRFQMDRFPGLGAFTQRNVEDFAAGGSQRDEMIGRQVAGTMLWSMSAMMAHAGMISGGGPKDPELRRQWLNVYKQPYSIRLPGTDEWVSYRRFEPLSTPLGIVADFMQTMGEHDNEGDVAKIIDGFTAGVAANLTSKTYLKSMSDFFYAMSSGKAAATDSFFDGLAGSFIPNMVQKLNPDDTLRSTRDFLDRLQSRIPGMSEDLEPRRNIYGEKVMKPGNQFQRMFNPFTVADTKADPVDIELLRLGAGMSMPVPRKYGVDLQDRSLGVNNQSPYDRWMELMSQPLVNGQSLRDGLRNFVQSDRYKTLTDGTEAYKGSRLLGVERIVRGYRQAAFAKMIRENPKLLDAIRTEAKKRGAALSDDPDVTEALTGHSTDEQLSGHAAEAAALMGQ